MIVLLSLLAAAWADPVVDALEAEAQRSASELRLAEAQPPWVVRYQLRDTHQLDLSAQLGGLLTRYESPRRLVGVEVRVGSAELDSANFESGWRPAGFRSAALVLDDDAAALRTDLWLQTDEAYKRAVEALATKRAAQGRKAEADEAPDYAPGEPHRAEAEAAPPLAPEPLEALARDLSARFLDRDGVLWSKVDVQGRTGRQVIVDAFGTRTVEPVAELSVAAVARAVADDGASVVDTVQWVVRGPDDLPSAEAMAAEVEALADRVEAWRELPVPEDTYIGPVLFEGDAAVDLFRYLAIPALQGTPAEEKPPRGSRVLVFSSNSRGGGGSALGVRRRLLPSGFQVFDDPAADPSLPGAYAVDDEGVPARRVQLVADGIVRTHYASRTPSGDVPESNGHGRGTPGRLIRGTAAVTTVEVDRETAPRKLHRQAMALAADYGQDHYVAIRRLTDPVGDGFLESPFSVFSFGSEAPALPAPVEVVRIYADGREEPVRSLKFVGADVGMLRDIVAARGSSTRSFLAPEADSAATAPGRLPTTLTAPDVLVGEVELAPDRGDAEKPPALPSPLATR